MSGFSQEQEKFLNGLVKQMSDDHAATYKKFFDENTKAYSVSATGHDITTTDGMRVVQGVWKNSYSCQKTKELAKETILASLIKKGFQIGWVPVAIYYWFTKQS